ncbi:MAG TPA: RNA-binding S4 domain-containing protein [Euzebya sp.]|nr:RNA-binding S4 domain-containing protein [Euzebya sp.]
MESIRVDRWLWSIRLYKTRTAASAACKAGHVTLNGDRAKPSALITVGDRIEARVGDRQRIVEVLAVIGTRVGAKVAAECYVDHSPAPAPIDVSTLIEGVRDRGAGRPTKRDRREMERLKGKRPR